MKKAYKRILFLMILSLSLAGCVSLGRQRTYAGYVDTTGHVVVDCRFDNAADFSEGLAAVEDLPSPNERAAISTYIDRAGTTRIRPSTGGAEVLMEVNAFSFNEGLAAFRVGRKWGYIDKRGCFVVSPRFDLPMPYAGGLAYAKVGSKAGYIDKTGRWVVQLGKVTGGMIRSGCSRSWIGQSLRANFFDSYHQGRLVVRIGKGFGYVDRQGKLLPTPLFEKAEPFFESLAAVKLHGKWGFIGKNGAWAIVPKYSDVRDFCEGLAAAAVHGKYGFVDKSGRMVIAPQFRSVGGFSEGLASVMVHHKLGYIRKDGEYAVTPCFDDGENFSNGRAVVTQGKKIGFINKLGQFTMVAGAIKMRDYSCGLAAVETRAGWGFVDTKGDFIVKPVYELVYDFSEDRAVVWRR